MSSKAVYTRFDPDLHRKVKEHAEVTGQSLSSAVEDLVQRGLGELTSEGRSETLEEELTSLKAHVTDVESKLASVEGDKKALEGQLEAYKTKASLALSAQKHAQDLEQQATLQAQQINQLRVYLSTNVAVCKNCHTYLRLYDIGQKRCAFCGSWGFDWVAGYQPPPTTWDALRDGAAVVGAATIVAALLKALDNGQKS